MVCQYPGCEVSSAVSASVISVADPICVVPMLIPKKLVSVKQALEQAAQHPETHVAFYQDEFSFRRQPTVAKDWTLTGTKHPLAHQSIDDDKTCYGIGALNAHTGDLVYQQIESATVVATHALYSEICLRYPNAERIFLIQDNRPVHLHPNLLCSIATADIVVS